MPTLSHGGGDVLNLIGSARIAQLVTSVAAAQTAVLPEGVYAVWVSVDTWVKVAVAASTGLTSSTGYLIRANTTVQLYVDQGLKIGAIAGGAGTLDAHLVG